MNHREIKTRLSAIVKSMLAKGMVTPQAGLHIEADRNDVVFLQWRGATATRYSEMQYECIHGDTPSQMLDNADAWVAEQVSASERKKQDFLEAMSKAVELGKEAGVDVELTDALLAAMKKLSENALTHTPLGEKADG